MTVGQKVKYLNLSIPILWVIALLYLGFHYQALPHTVAIHFNLAGEADDFGGKGHLWALPIIFLVLWSVCTVLIGGLPKLINVLEEKPKSRQHEITILTILFLLLHISVWLMYMNQLYNVKRGEHEIMGYLILLPFISVGVFIVLMVIRWFKTRKTKA
ncbi:DUF1648 domain-containing protein [Staphylococcus ratti]|uniref:DUF1648 domain-containing protein n=1 Tax=Staphylococcus ratti TaxID=2892440 RepID=A0ABY3PDF8_9STAP|nr:DUF1648 domain-containing protein [Staphylococcus ratti]UEX90362.1 DUF1648 domain-containing protein [Staphylococcus ratti]